MIGHKTQFKKTKQKKNKQTRKQNIEYDFLFN